LRSLEPLIKSKIVKNFGNASKIYDKKAMIQRDVSRCLVALLDIFLPKIPCGDIVDIGCGTGFLSLSLLDRYPGESFCFIDKSPAMLHILGRKLVQSLEKINLHVGDGENVCFETSPAMIASNLALQWFVDPYRSIRNWYDKLTPGGVLLFSIQTSESYEEWRSATERLTLPYTANPLPETERVLSVMRSLPGSFLHEKRMIRQTFSKSREFFQYLKDIGATTPMGNQRSVGLRDFSRLLEELDSRKPVNITSCFVLVCFQKPLRSS